MPACCIFEFDDERTGLFDGNRLNGHPAKNLRRTMGEMWLEGERGVMRLDGEARLWWQPHRGVEAPMPTTTAPVVAPSAAPAPRCRPTCWPTCARARALENGARDYLANLHVQAAVYHSHASGRRVPMAGFDPHHP